MSFETVERLKRDYTDKWVTVDTSTPELRRFVGLSGQIKTVNMNGRALVQFDNPVDISWYDIDLSYLKIVDAPAPKKAEKHAEPAEKKPAAAAPKPAAATGGKSPLELAREQAAAKAAAAGGAPAAAPAATGDKPLSKIELARQQAAAAAAARAAGGAAPAPAAAAPASTPTAPAPTPAASVETPAPAAPTPAAAAPAAANVMVDENGKPLSKLEMARRQGAFKPK